MKKINNKIKLRYGENPNQKAFLIKDKSTTIFNYQLSGKEIGYNNIIDVDSGLRCLGEFTEPTAVIIKHTNPCGVASSKKLYDAFKKAYKSDSKSAFGGIVLLNRKIDFVLARYLIKYFFEIIVAADYDKKALQLLETKKKLIILKIPKQKKQKIEFRSTIFGNLFQNIDTKPINKNFLKLVSNKKSNSKIIEDIIFSLKVVKHLKSNAIVLSYNKQTLGLGHGQTNRIDALKHAIRNKKLNFKNKKFVCVSDGFFPFTDAINLLKNNFCFHIAQPSGSINDRKIIDFAKLNNLSLYFIKNRLFKH